MSKAITVLQPWSSFLFVKPGGTDILAIPESTDYRGPLVIVSDALVDEARVSPGELDIKEFPLGRILGVRHLVDCRLMEKEDEGKANKFYMKGLFSWVFDERIELLEGEIQAKEFGKSGVVYDVRIPNGIVVAPMSGGVR